MEEGRVALVQQRVGTRYLLRTHFPKGPKLFLGRGNVFDPILLTSSCCVYCCCWYITTKGTNKASDGGCWHHPLNHNFVAKLVWKGTKEGRDGNTKVITQTQARTYVNV